MRPALAATLGAVLLAGGAGVYTLRTSGALSGCPGRDDLQPLAVSFRQEPRHYIHVTLTNANDCYGIRDEPVEITLYGPHGRRAISYYGEQAPHGDVGVCCNATVPPHGRWTIRLGAPGASQGLDDIRICGILVEPVNRDPRVWKRMPQGGDLTGHGSFPPKSVFDPDKFPPLPDDPTWRRPCESPSPPSP